MEEQKTYIPPDYDKDDDEIDDIDELDEDEGSIEFYYDQKLKEEESKEQKPMTTPFTPPPQPSTTPRWGQPNTGTTNLPWQQNQGSMWGPSNSGGWKPSTTPSWGNTNNQSQKMEINRSKKVIFIDFLDGIVETFNSNQVPGFLPRDIFDLTPRFDVWHKLLAFNPERVYIMTPKNLLPSTNGAHGWEAALTYFCCALSSFLRVPFTNCQILVGSVIGQSKESLMRSVIDDPRKPINKDEVICVGIYSGVNGQPNTDIKAATDCGVDYVDLYNLLNNMI